MSGEISNSIINKEEDAMKYFKKHYKNALFITLFTFFQPEKISAMKNKPTEVVHVQKMSTFAEKPLPSQKPIQSGEVKLGLLDRAKSSLAETKQSAKDAWKQSGVKKTLQNYQEGQQIKKERETHEKSFAELQQKSLKKEQKIAALEKQIQEKKSAITSAKPMSDQRKDEQLNKIIALQDKLDQTKKKQETHEQQLGIVKQKLAQSKETEETFKNLKGKNKGTPLTTNLLKDKEKEKGIDVEKLLQEKRSALEKTKKQAGLEAEKVKKETTPSDQSLKVVKEETTGQKVKGGIFSGIGSTTGRILVMALAAPLLAFLAGTGTTDTKKLTKQGVSAGVDELSNGGSADAALTAATDAMLNGTASQTPGGIKTVQDSTKDSSTADDESNIPFITPPDERPVKVAVSSKVQKDAATKLNIVDQIKKKAEALLEKENEKAKKLLVATAEAQKNAAKNPTEENQNNVDEASQQTQEALMNKMKAEATNKLARESQILLQVLSQS